MALPDLLEGSLQHGKRVDWIKPYSPGAVRDVDYTGDVRIRCDRYGLECERNRPERLQAVAGDEQDDAVGAADLARRDRRPERPERHAGSGLAEDAGGAREKGHALAHLVLGDGVHGARGLAGGRHREVAVRRGPDRERAGDRVRPARGLPASLAERLATGWRPLPGRRSDGRRAVESPRSGGSPNPADLVEEGRPRRSGSRRRPVRSAQLLRQLVRERLRALGVASGG
jgi:hypothetical protein